MEWKELWQELPVGIKQQFEDSAKTLELKRGQFVYQQGDQPAGVYFVEQGLVGLMLVGQSSGKEHLVRFFKQGQYFGHRSLFSDEGYHGTTVAIETTTLKLVPKQVLIAAIDAFPSLLKDVVRVLSKELRRCENHQVMILENEILARTALAIVYLKDLHPHHNWTRQEIANFCASTPSTVIKALAELEERRLIQQTGRSITIIDRVKLISLQDGDS